MRKILIILSLILCGSALFGQSPRIRLNQITKDSLTGSIVLSGSDSNMVYSRDFFLNLTDSVLILFGDTLSTTATAFTGVATDLTLTGNGTVGNELKVDTAIIATITALADSLAGIISSVTTDLTLTGDGSIATPLKVDTSVIATIRALSDSLATLSFATNQDISDSLATLSFASLQDITDTLDLNTRDFITGLRLTDTLNTNSRGFLTQNQTITLTDDATGTGTTSISVTVVDDSHNHTISTLTGIQDSLNSKAALIHTHTISDVAFLQDSLDAKANDSDLNNYLLTSNYIVDSTRINATGDTAYYYQNGVLIGTGAIAGGGGGSGTVTSVDVSGGTTGLTTSGGPVTTSGTITLAGTLDVDNGGTGATSFTAGQMLKGNGTSAIQAASNLRENGDTTIVNGSLFIGSNQSNVTIYENDVPITDGVFTIGNATGLSGNFKPIFFLRGNTSDANYANGFIFDITKDTATAGPIGIFDARQNNTTVSNRDLFHFTNGFSTIVMAVEASGEVGIGTANPAHKLDVVGTAGLSTGTAWTNTSDFRFKKIRDNLDTEQYLNKLIQLNPISFQWNDLHYNKYQSDINKTNYGFLAQQVESVFPSMVTTDDDGYKWYNPSGFEAILTGAIKQQQAIIEQQATEIEQLKTQIQLILTEIEQIKNN